MQIGIYRHNSQDLIHLSLSLSLSIYIYIYILYIIYNRKYYHTL